MSGLEWALALTAVAVFVLLALALVFLVLGLVILPLVLSALRRLAAASAGLDGADLARRLPENGVVSELQPVVRAFNTALDRVEAASHRRDRLIADIAHELRTPLAVLTLRSETLPDGPPAAEVRRGLARLTQLIAQMLDAERLGAADRRRVAVDLVDLARGAVADIAPLALAEGYQLAFEAEAERLSVDGDRAAIGRAIGNLLGNAVAHGGGAGVIQVRVRAPGVVEVEDAGVGLPEGAHQRVFEPFHRERWDKDGCGLGLHLVREVMHAHGGRAEAADGASGALFRLIFPAAPA
jgi:signal transduction histidine kinase